MSTDRSTEESSEYTTCDDCGCVHSVYDEHEPNNCVEVMRGIIARLTAERDEARAQLAALREAVLTEAPVLERNLNELQQLANAALARLVAKANQR